MSDGLHEALARHDLGAIVDALRGGADVDGADPTDGCRPLHKAIYELDFGGPFDALTRLLDAGAGVNLRAARPGAETPLIAAIREGRADAVGELLARGADPNVIDGFGESPLRLAVAAGAHDTAHRLIHHGALRSIDSAGGETGRTALGQAAADLDLRMVELLLSAGADPTARDVDGRVAADHLAPRRDGDAAAERARARLVALLVAPRPPAEPS